MRVGLAPPSDSLQTESLAVEIVGRAVRRENDCVTRLPGAPAFWSAFGGPASPGQRGRAEVN